MKGPVSIKPGQVYLVGAGPGDPELLTVKALRILETADIVLHDDLVPPEILRLVRVGARIYNVGKRCGVKRLSQETINALMVNYAAAGLDVVRLKGGDPMIFGRADQEVAILRSAGMQFEVVPGITAALGAAAAAQIPLTQRHLSSAVVLTSYHRAINQIDWTHIIATGATIVLYMPGDDYQRISRELRAAGLRGQTPCMIASRAATPQQLLVTTTLNQLPEVSPLPAPALLIIGPVSRFAAIPAAESDPAENLDGDRGQRGNLNSTHISSRAASESV